MARHSAGVPGMLRQGVHEPVDLGVEAPGNALGLGPFLL